MYLAQYEHLARARHAQRQRSRPQTGRRSLQVAVEARRGRPPSRP